MLHNDDLVRYVCNIIALTMTRPTINLNLDVIGMATSLLCAVHCALIPTLLSFSSLAGIRFLDNVWLESTIILLSFFIASYALVHGFLKYHKSLWALLIVCIGFSGIGLGHLTQTGINENMLVSGGATTVAIAHLINWKEIKRVRGVIDNEISKNENL